MFIGNFNICCRWVSKFFNYNKNINISPKSFDDLKIWLKDIKNNANPDLKIFLLGNKNDLIEERIINTEEGNDIKKEFNINLYKETAVKNEKNSENVFLEATYLLLNDNNKDTNDKNIKQKDCCIF